jgi:hypothetical protein
MRRTKWAQRRPRLLEAGGVSAHPEGLGQLRAADVADAAGVHAPAGNTNSALWRAGGGPPASTGPGMQAERRRSTGEAPSVPGRPGRRRRTVTGTARRRRMGRLISHSPRRVGKPRTGGRTGRQSGARPGHCGRPQSERSTSSHPPCGEEPTKPGSTSGIGFGTCIGAARPSCYGTAGRTCIRARPVGATRSRRRRTQSLGPTWRPGRRACKRNAPGPSGSDAAPDRTKTAVQGPWGFPHAQRHWSNWPVRSCERRSRHKTFWIAATAIAPAVGRWRRSAPAPSTCTTGSRGLG